MRVPLQSNTANHMGQLHLESSRAAALQADLALAYEPGEATTKLICSPTHLRQLEEKRCAAGTNYLDDVTQAGVVEPSVLEVSLLPQKPLVEPLILAVLLIIRPHDCPHTARSTA